MKTDQEVIEFIKYVEQQLHCMVKPENFILQDYMNKVLLDNKGYEDYFIVIHEDMLHPNNVSLHKYSEEGFMSADIIDLFPKKPFDVGEITVKLDPLEYWRLRNEIISDEFQLYNAYQKQEILDTVLSMNLELYTLVFKLKEKLK